MTQVKAEISVIIIILILYYLFLAGLEKKTGFFGLNQGFFQSHICVFLNENSHVLEQLITNINYYLI